MKNRKAILLPASMALMFFAWVANSFETVFPDFKGSQAEFGMFKTRITDAMKKGPDFSGHYSLVIIGCGTGCAIVFVADNKTGKVFDFPFGGEKNSQMLLEYGLAADTVLVSYRDYSDTGTSAGDICVAKRLRFLDGKFVEEQSKQSNDRDFICPVASEMLK